MQDNIESPWAAWGKFVGAMIDRKVAQAVDLPIDRVEVEMLVVGDPDEPSEWGVNVYAYDAAGKLVKP